MAIQSETPDLAHMPRLSGIPHFQPICQAVLGLHTCVRPIGRPTPTPKNSSLDISSSPLHFMAAPLPPLVISDPFQHGKQGTRVRQFGSAIDVDFEHVACSDDKEIDVQLVLRPSHVETRAPLSDPPRRGSNIQAPSPPVWLGFSSGPASDGSSLSVSAPTVGACTRDVSPGVRRQ